MKNSIKKLTLNKVTISNLNSLEMNAMVGGGTGKACMTAANCSSPCPATKLLCNPKTKF